jgi:glyoxylase-like metal-dependent hydrolase (beta-lactamase superfamily II)
MKTEKKYSPILYVIGVFFITASLSTFAADDDQYKDVLINTVEVRDGIYMLIGAGGNIGVSVGEDGVFLIDDQFAPLTEKIKAAIAKLSDQPIRFLINTHWHYDHTGGNENLGKENVLIVAHDNVHKRMSVDTLIGAFATTVPASPKVALPVITFNDTVTFRINGEEIQVFHQSNAHTDGDSVVHFIDSNVMHTGDVWFNGFYPFIDTSSEGSIDGVIKSVKHLLTIVDDKTRIIPGHGKLANKNDLNGYLEMLMMVRSRMQKLIDEGKSIDQIIELKPLADYDESLGGGFLKPEQFMRIVHDSLTR